MKWLEHPLSKIADALLFSMMFWQMKGVGAEGI